MYTRIGPYQPLKKLATGGMADIFLARKGVEGTDLCALKVLLPDHGSNQPVRENFSDEAIILESLNHPAIIRFNAHGTEYERPYFELEYVHGLSGAEIMFEARKAKKSVPLGLALGIIKAIAEALDHGYTAPNGGTAGQIVHNDISPHNFQIGFDGSIKLLDYGVAIREKAPLRHGRRGKFAYMAPEAVEKKPLDHRSDLFSLGISFYEMVVHKRAFKAATPDETMQRIVAGDIKRPSEFSAGFPRTLESIMMKCLATVPQQRFQTGKALAHAIDAFASTQRIDLSQETQAKRLEALVGPLAAERNAELETLISEAPSDLSSPGTVESTAQLINEDLPDVEIVMMELPTIPLKYIATASALLVTVGLICLL